jgi:hypothetical protein
MKTFFAFASMFLWNSFNPIFAVPAIIDAPIQNQTSSTKISPQEEVRAAVFTHLEKLSESKSQIPDFPSEKLLLWVDGRHGAVSQTPKARYTLLCEHLLIAQLLLKSDDLSMRKRGFWIASESANFASAKLPKDKWLLSRIFEGFLLPYVSLANAEVWQDPSRQRVIEGAVSAFANSKERPKQISVLEWLLLIGERQKEPNLKTTNPNALVLETNTLDWARGTLANVLFTSPDATKDELERSLSLLVSIQSPDMAGFQHLRKRVQARLDEFPKQP